MQLLLGLILGALVGVLAYRAGALTRAGAMAAALTGGLIFGLGGLPWAVLLLAFFISSSLLSKAFAPRKAYAHEKFSKGSQRDAGQVLANGGLATGLVILHALFPAAIWPWAAFLGSLAAVNADTWATELGVLSRRPPRLITTGQVVPGGTSGAVSGLGNFAAAGGALLIALAAQLFSPHGPLLAAVWLGGLFGAGVDSLLGATLQAVYYCPRCDKETERHPHHLCGEETLPRRGLPWLGNDLVNFLCSVAGAGAALLFYTLFKQ